MRAEQDRARGGIRRAQSRQGGAGAAVAELAEGLGASELKGLIFFCSPEYDLEELGRAVEKRFGCPAMGCTTAGEILSPEGHMESGLVGVGFAGGDPVLEVVGVPSVEAFARDPAGLGVAGRIPRGEGNALGVLLVDGLAGLEERVAAGLYRELGRLPMIGGSAGDGMKFRQTQVYAGGRFHRNAAVLGLLRTERPFRMFHVHHFEPTEEKLVITEAEASTRTVKEINGRLAVEEYARAVGLSAGDMAASVFAAHPLMLRIGGSTTCVRFSR